MEESIIGVLTWREPAVSLALILSFNALYFIIFVLRHGILNIIGWGGFTLMFVSSPLGLIPSTTSAPPGLAGAKRGDSDALETSPQTKHSQFLSTSKKEVISAECIQGYLWLLYDQVNDIGESVRNVLFWRDARKSFIILVCFAIAAHTIQQLQLSLPAALYLIFHGIMLANLLQKFKSNSVEYIKLQLDSAWKFVPKWSDPSIKAD